MKGRFFEIPIAIIKYCRLSTIINHIKKEYIYYIFWIPRKFIKL